MKSIFIEKYIQLLYYEIHHKIDNLKNYLPKNTYISLLNILIKQKFIRVSLSETLDKIEARVLKITLESH